MIRGALMAMFLGLFLPACRKGSGIENALTTGNSSNKPGVLSALIDGKPWIALDTTRFASLMNGSIILSGTDSDDQTIAISLGDTIKGNYVLSKGEPNLAIYTNSLTFMQDFSTNQGSNSSQAGGSVLVTEIDKVNQTISGTFIFNVFSDSAQYKKTITQGVFNKLPYFTALPLAKSTDTFYTQIDGVNWTAPSISSGLIAGVRLVKGSEQNGLKSVAIYLPSSLPLYIFPFQPDFLYGVYVDNGQTYSTVSIIPLPDSIYEMASYDGSLQILEYDSTAHRLRANFSFKAATQTGLSSVQVSQGYFSVHY
jgi:hypothetical protein